VRLNNHCSQSEVPDGCFGLANWIKGQYLLAGYHCRVMFSPTGKNKGRPWEYLIVEEGRYVDGEFKADRILNGDQTDWSLNFAEPAVFLFI